jgi:hypothetical protein
LLYGHTTVKRLVSPPPGAPGPKSIIEGCSISHRSQCNADVDHPSIIQGCLFFFCTGIG